MATQSERKELFISYGREPEVIQFVTRLKGDLENHGFSVWMDVHDISAGSDWHGAIGTGLTQCRAIVPIITSKYIGSRYCTNEVVCVCMCKVLYVCECEGRCMHVCVNMIWLEDPNKLSYWLFLYTALYCRWGQEGNLSHHV